MEIHIAELLHGIELEEQRARSTLHLTPNENILSLLARRLLSSDLGMRYYFGKYANVVNGIADFGGLLIRALPWVDEFQVEALRAAQELLGRGETELRALSGVHAMATTISAITEIGDVVYSLPRSAGGHFATQHVVSSLGRRSATLAWSEANYAIDSDRSCQKFEQLRPAVIFLDHGAPVHTLDLRMLRDVAPAGTVIVYDASHTLGLIVGNRFQHPILEGCDIIQGNTHKSFPGPQKALIHSVDPEMAARISQHLSQGLVSSQHTQEALALYATLLEMQAHSNSYASQMLKNSNALAGELAKCGLVLVSRDGQHSESHQLLVDLGRREIASTTARMMAAGISLNGREVYGRSVLRLGVQEVTRRGLLEDDMVRVGSFLRRLLLSDEPVELVGADVKALMREAQNVQFCFDGDLGLR